MGPPPPHEVERGGAIPPEWGVMVVEGGVMVVEGGVMVAAVAPRVRGAI